MSKSDNPIIAAVERTLQGRRPTIVLDANDADALRPGLLKKVVSTMFSDETIRDVGTQVIESLLTGDRRIVKIVEDAIKEADHLFSRDREPVLLRQAAGYIYGQGKKLDGVPLETLRKSIEDRFNCGQRLPQYKWNRLRKALHLPKDSGGRPRNSDTKRGQSVS